MKVVASSGREDVAVVYIMEAESGKLVECVESIQPPIPREQKWVLLVSTLYGCPIGCKMCDAGGSYHGKLTKQEIFAQIDFLVRQRFPSGDVPCGQFKIQLSRMGEPASNTAVLDVLDELPQRYRAPGLMPSLSTVAPAGTDRFFERLLDIKRTHYTGGHFQLQFSIHTTDIILRDQIIPVKKWGFAQIAAYVQRYYAPGDRKVTLNFALATGMPVDPDVLLGHFNPGMFLIKITPLNPTYRASQNGLSSFLDPAQGQQSNRLVDSLRTAGYEVIVSIGDAEENRIGSNCGQFLRTHLEARAPIAEGYTYAVQEHVSA
jgi:23S rRNA (adenine2503-C2)-methyltransferase